MLPWLDMVIHVEQPGLGSCGIIALDVGTPVRHPGFARPALLPTVRSSDIHVTTCLHSCYVFCLLLVLLYTLSLLAVPVPCRELHLGLMTVNCLRGFGSSSLVFGSPVLICIRLIRLVESLAYLSLVTRVLAPRSQSLAWKAPKWDSVELMNKSRAPIWACHSHTLSPPSTPLHQDIMCHTTWVQVSWTRA